MERAEVNQRVTLVESPLSQRRSSISSISSSSSSSTPSSPSKTLATVDLSLPLSEQIVTELQSGDFRFSANYFSHITGDLQGRNNSYIYQIEEEDGQEDAEEDVEEENPTAPTKDANSSEYRLNMMKTILSII